MKPESMANRLRESIDQRDGWLRSWRLDARRALAIAVAMLLALLPAFAQTEYPAHPATSPAITAADLSARDKAISDDAFHGRAPATPSGEAAASWLADEMKRIGLRPGNHGSYFQPMPAVTITLDVAKSSFGFKTPHAALSPRFGDEVVYWTPRFASNRVTLSYSLLIFVGYGVVAPEYDWDDYAGANVRGRWL
jgi:hypothetical protein